MIGLKTVDSFSQEEAGQGYVDYHRDHEVPVQVLNRSEARVNGEKRVP